MISNHTLTSLHVGMEDADQSSGAYELSRDKRVSAGAKGNIQLLPSNSN